MKRVVIIASALLMLMALVSCSTMGGNKILPTVSVSGSATITVAPDSASFSITAESTMATTEEARNASATMVADALELLRDEFGLSDDSLTTDYMVVSPYYEWVDTGRVLVGQKATQRLTIVLSGDNLEKVGKVYDRLSVLDGISISSISYSKLDTTLEVMEAREKAAKAALEKAEAYAKGLGKSVGDVITISDGSSVSYSNYAYPTALKVASVDESYAGYTSTSYYQGTVSVSDTVTVVFTLK